MKKTLLVAWGAALLLVPGLAGAGTSAPRPPDIVDVSVGGQQMELWPFTANDFSGAPSDPVNLVFPDTDPRQLRQALMALDATRPPFAALPFAGCVWRDAMGSEQVAWAETEGWAGSAVQLACVKAGAPLGDPFRVHVRFFRQGTSTLGAAHLDFLIPGSAEHESISWELPRSFVTYDMARTGLLTGPPTSVALIAPGTLGVVRRPIFDGLVAGGAGGLLAFLGLSAPPSGDVPIPVSGQATILASRIVFEPKKATLREELEVVYGINVPKPFCATGPTDFVRLQGPLRLAMTTRTTASGDFSRTYTISGLLTVTPLPTGAPANGVVFEEHVALLTDRSADVHQLVSQTLLTRPIQALLTSLSVGRNDRHTETLTCGS